MDYNTFFNRQTEYLDSSDQMCLTTIHKYGVTILEPYLKGAVIK